MTLMKNEKKILIALVILAVTIFILAMANKYFNELGFIVTFVTLAMVHLGFLGKIILANIHIEIYKNYYIQTILWYGILLFVSFILSAMSREWGSIIFAYLLSICIFLEHCYISALKRLYNL